MRSLLSQTAGTGLNIPALLWTLFRFLFPSDPNSPWWKSSPAFSYQTTGSFIHLVSPPKYRHTHTSACPPLPPWKPKVQRDGLRLHALAWPSTLFCVFPVLLLQDCFSSLPPPFSALYLHLTSSSPKYLPCVLSLPGADAAQMIDPLPLAIWLWLHKTANKVETAGQLIMEISLKLYSFMV